MKIESLYISAFGKFKDYTLSFEDGLNLFYGQNEDGKSTILSFIKMMFYGSGTKGGDLLKNPRKKYAPWDDSTMAGSIDFTHENTSWRIERIFGASNSTDKITLIDKNLGTREAYSGTTELGVRFFGLTSAAFERCMFIAQLNLGEIGDDPSGEINRKLSSLILTGEEDVSEKQISARLLAAKEELMSKGGKKGRFDQNRIKLAALKEELLKSKNAEEEREALALKIENQKNRLVLVQKEIDRTSAALKATESNRHFKKLKDFIEISDELSNFEGKLKKADGSIISVSELAETENAVAKYKLLSQQIPALKEQIEMLKAETEEQGRKNDNSPLLIIKEKCDTLNKELEEKRAQAESITEEIDAINKQKDINLSKKAKPRILFVVTLFLAAVIAVLGVFVSKFALPLYITGGAVAVLSLILLLAFKKKPAALTKQDTAKLNELKENLGFTNSQMQNIRTLLKEQNELLTVLNGEAENAANIKKEKLDLLNSAQNKYNETLNSLKELNEYFAVMFPKENMTASVSGMEIVLHAYKDYSRKVENAKAKLGILKADLGDISKQAAEIKLNEFKHSATGENDPKQLQDHLSFKQKEAADIQKSIAYDEALARTAFASWRHPTEIEHEIAETTDILNSQQQFCDSIDIALSALNTAFASTRQSFGAVLEKRTCEIFENLTQGKYNKVSISKDFEITVEKTDVFGTKQWQYLSSGTADQVYFALRLAISELLSNECKGLPILLDDSFALYDDTRLTAAIEFLEQYSKNNQVLYFTCRKAGIKEGQNFKYLV